MRNEPVKTGVGRSESEAIQWFTLRDVLALRKPFYVINFTLAELRRGYLFAQGPGGFVAGLDLDFHRTTVRTRAKK